MKRSLAIKADLDALAAKAQSVVDNPRLTNRQKAHALDQIEVDMKHAKTDLADFESVEAKSRLYEQFASTNHDPFSSGVVFGSSEIPVVNSAPSLRIDVEGFKALQSAALDHRALAVKASNVTEGTIDPATYPSISGGPIGIAREPQRVLDLIPLLPAPETGIVQYYVVTGTTSATAIAEGDQKPLSDIAFAATPGTIRKIAHRMVVTDEVIEDFVGFQAYAQAEMTRGLIDAESNEILNGSGSAPHIQGLLGTSGVGSITPGLDSPLTTLERGITSLRASGRYVEPDALVMSPYTYSSLITQVDSQLRYLAGNPLEAGPPNLWGVKCVLTTKMPGGKVLAGNFAEACRGWVKGGIRLIADTDADDFSHNRVTFICEERLLTVAVAPAALTVIDLRSEIGSA